MKKKSILLTIAFVLTILFSVPGFAVGNEFGNEWVYDEPQVVSSETEAYIKDLNENVFTQYENKPQLAIVMVNDLPYEMNDYKLDLFNDYGVGTAEENCGMLFVFAINDREYGLEIGDGFEEGSLLRRDLESDFITEDMKDSLRSGDYDGVILQVTQYLENVMADEENGVYVQKEEEKQAAHQATVERIEAMFDEFYRSVRRGAISLLIFLSVSCIAVLPVYLFKLYLRNKKIISLAEANYKYVRMAQTNAKEFLAYVHENHADLSISQLEEKTLDLLYALYLDKQMKHLEDNPPIRAHLNKYKNALRRTNDFRAFKNCQLSSLNTITYRVDANEKEKAEMAKRNSECINKFFHDNQHRIIHQETSSTIYEHLRRYMYSDKPVTQDALEEAFVNALNEANFRWEVDQFLAEHSDQAQSQYFDRSSFYRELSASDNFCRYHYTDNYDRSWMYPLLVMHMGSRKKAHEEEIIRLNAERAHREEMRREEERRREQERMDSYHSSFGSGFGGGHSSGGGFKGGW